MRNMKERSTYSSVVPCKQIHYYRDHLEMIHDQLPLAVPCYDLVPVIEFTLGPPCGGTSGAPDSLDLTGGEYKTRERIHRGIADPRLLAIPTS